MATPFHLDDSRRSRFLKTASRIALTGFRSSKGAARKTACLQYVNILLYLYEADQQASDGQIVKGLAQFFDEIVASDVFAMENFKLFDEFCAAVRSVIEDLDLRLFLQRAL